MGCPSNPSPFRITAANAFWGRKNKVCIDTDSNFLLADGEYFLVSNLDTDYYVFVTVDGGTTDPAPAGKTPINLVLTSGYTASDLASELKTKVEAVPGFFVTLSENDTCACIELNKLGAPLSVAADVDSGLTIVTSVVGIGGSLGKTTDGIEVSTELNTIEITSDQNGAVPEDIVVSGNTISVTMTLLEMSKEKWNLIIGEVSGNKYTPAGGTEVVGYGTDRNFQSLFDLAGCLLLEPIDRPNRDEDLLFFKAIPLPESFSFSGTDTLSMSVSFQILNDNSKDSKINLMACGDVSQDFRQL